MKSIVSKNLDSNEKSWTFLDGSKRSAVILDSAIIGRGTYLPGWRWSEHVGKQSGKKSERHIGYVISGQMVISGPDGKEVRVSPGDAFEISPGHDARVVGKEPCIALDFERIEKTS